ncbi:MAG: hypothetical protein ACUVSA_13230 [Desulfosoma sp.]|uniref:hypothetical protein n=1 Tax=Desulfosoma sp. TaxID=2603217 RepID=UPI0040493531
MNPPHEPPDVWADHDQVLVWIHQGDQACAYRHFIKAIRYYQLALDLARHRGFRDLQGRLCRDLGYLYLHHHATDKARSLLHEGLEVCADDSVLCFGLLSNLVSVSMLENDYRQGLARLNQALDIFEKAYPDISTAPFDVMASYAALYRLRRSLRRIVALLDEGVDPNRIRVIYRLAPAPWDPKG